jgi:polyisoprenoid-binding protein YceI
MTHWCPAEQDPNNEKEKSMNKRFAILVALALASTSLFAADTYVIDPVHSSVAFTIRHLVSKVTGKFNDFSGSVNIDPKKLAGSSVDFAIKTASIDTGNGDRDKHLRSGDFFDAEKYPEITFKSSSVKSTAKNKYNVAGTLTMHGVSKQVVLPVEFGGFGKDMQGNEKAGFELSTKLDRKAYGINWNKAVDNGTLLGDEVAVNINLETGKKK